MTEKLLAARARSRLKTRQMNLLIALDEVRNIHQAAIETDMSQPAASKMLKDIEAIFGVPLFERLPRGVAPTIYGDAVIRHVRMSLSCLSQAQEAVATLQAGLSGQVNVGAIITPCPALIPQAIIRTKREAPRLCISFEVSTSNDLVARLKQGQLDFVLGRLMEQEDEPNLIYEDLSVETECVVARRDHPLMTRPDLRLEDVVDAGWILSGRGSILRNRFDMMFRRAGLEIPSNTVDTTSVLVVMNMLIHTDFLHIVPVDVAAFYMRSGEIARLPIDVPCTMENYGIIQRRDQLPAPGTHLLLKHIRDVAAEIF
ncbi:LysR family transcriptional regulator [Propionivibrio dicarboxylicus]|uniref:DNA-binding transcriptional regulator, LysR family n=1 Tax=Propionivibrio dicarboxylicus TaxID=83767 RepID=A0A1G8NGX0_9RHOO|nr:LysR family transcriptional regulator [Propionivibrio dicarboxylicus]SDI79509.1 DNA-binding transcriptional regulator, LysR family [Propionivibrio dicarboxylicus]